MARQTDFSAGEVDPLLHGRTDLPLFQKACRTLKNFFVSKHGSAHTRPGTHYLGEAKYVDGPTLGDRDIGQVRLIPFDAGASEELRYDGAQVASDLLTQSYALEVGNQYIRFWSNDGQVVDGGGNAYEVTQYTDLDGVPQTLPYISASRHRLCYAQIGDSLILTHPLFPPIELRRNGHADWTARELDFHRDYLDAYCDVDDPSVVTSPFGFVTSTPGEHSDYTLDDDHPEREWIWRVSAIVQDSETGEKFETRASYIGNTWDGSDWDASHANTTDDNAVVYLDMHVTLRRGLQSPSGAPPERAIIAYNFYRGRGNLFGFIGTTTTREFVDVGAEPDYSKQPPRGTNPFEVLNADGTLNRTERPVAATHFQSRRVFGGTVGEDGTPQRIDTLLASRTNDFFDFDVAELIDVPGEAVEFPLASERREEIRHLIARNKLLVGTTSSWWSVNGGQGQPLDYDHVEAEVIDEEGVGLCRPVLINGAIVFTKALGGGVRALIPQGAEGYEAMDISTFAQHFFVGASKHIVEMAYARNPWGVLWCVRADGVLLSLTMTKDSLAWAQHETDGLVESICAIPQGDEDAVYISVIREKGDESPHRYIERITSRHARGGAVIASGSPTVRDPSDILTDADYICLDSALSYLGPAATTFTGLGHLEGKEVYAFVSGQPLYGPETVTGGEVSFGAEISTNVVDEGGTPMLLAYIGLAYTCDLELLDIAGGEARQKQKQVTHVGFEVDNSQGLQAGQDFDHLTSVPSRDVQDAFGAPGLRTQVVVCPIKGHSNLSARACLRQTLPLPATVLGVSRRLKFGGGNEG